MSSLAEIQALVWRAITWPTGVDAFLRASDEATRAAFAATFAETPAFDRQARVGIYADAYFFRLLGVLRDHFGLVAWLCGPAHFHDLVTDYVWQLPSIDPDVRRYGERFPAFVAGHREGARIDGLAEIAAIEWAMVRALDLPQSPPLERERLQALPADAWPELRLRAVESAVLLPTRLPFSALWQHHTDAPTPASPPAPAAAHTVLVWRQGLDVVHRVPDPDEAAALTRVREGVVFAELCEGHEPATINAWLQRWLADTLLVG